MNNQNTEKYVQLSNPYERLRLVITGGIWPGPYLVNIPAEHNVTHSALVPQEIQVVWCFPSAAGSSHPTGQTL